MSEASTVTVGFLGLGTMGSGMAARLLESGAEVRVWNRGKDPVAELVAKGAVEAPEARDALAADISFSMLANDAAVDAVLSSENLTAGTTHVNMASISPKFATQLQERFEQAGVRYAAAPVLGRPAVAAAGQLNILSAGPADVLEAAKPYFELMGKQTWHFGETPSIANSIKALCNYILIQAHEALGETIAMAERLDVDPGLFVELLNSTFVGGPAYTVYGPIIATQSYTPAAFTMTLGRKDLDLLEQVAEATDTHVPSLPALKAVYERALAEGMADYDWSAIAEVTRRNLLK